jgi:hypothetical protein
MAAFQSKEALPMSLFGDFLDNQQRVAHKWVHYFSAYEAHFARFINRPVVLFEIGVAQGGSGQMWKRYLGPHALIVGLDINENCRGHEEDSFIIRIGDQSDPVFLQSVLDEFGAPNIVLDDGSHQQSHIIATFHYLYPRMAPDGVYFIEDMHTAYLDEFGGGLRRQGSAIEMCKDLIDELNAGNGPTDFTRSTMSMHFYDSIAVFERGRRLPRKDIMTGKVGTFGAY